MALLLELFNFAGSMKCWIHQSLHNSPYSHQCDDPYYAEFCGRGGNHSKDFEYYVGAHHLSLSFLIIVMSMIVLHCTVRRVEVQAQRWNPARRFTTAGTTGADGTGASTFAATTTNTSTVISAQARTSQAQVGRASALRMSQRTMETGTLYSLSVILVYLPTIILSLQLDVGLDYHSVLASNSILLPLQGFFNMIICCTAPSWRPYIREKWISILQSSQQQWSSLKESWWRSCCSRGDREDNDNKYDGDDDDDHDDVIAFVASTSTTDEIACDAAVDERQRQRSSKGIDDPNCNSDTWKRNNNNERQQREQQSDMFTEQGQQEPQVSATEVLSAEVSATQIAMTDMTFPSCPVNLIQ